MPFRGECRGRLHPHSCSTLALACFLDCWGELPSIFYLPSSVGRVIERACVCLSLGSARVVERRRCCYASRHARVATEGHCGGRSRSRARSAFVLALLVGAEVLRSTVAHRYRIVAYGTGVRRSFALDSSVIFFVVSLVWLSGGLGLGVRGHARAPARVRRLVVRRRRFGCLNCCTCVCMLVARSHSCRRLASVLSRRYGAPRVGLLGTGVVARARVHALLVGACFLVRLIVERGCCCVRTPTARHRSCFRWGGRSCRVARAARACVPALCGICTRVAVWSLGWPLGHQGTQKTQ